MLTTVTKSPPRIVSSPSKNLGLTSCLMVVFFPFLVGDELIVLKSKGSFSHSLILTH